MCYVKCISKLSVFQGKVWAGAMSQQLRALSGLAEDLGSNLSTHSMAHHIVIPVLGHLLASEGAI